LVRRSWNNVIKLAAEEWLDEVAPSDPSTYAALGIRHAVAPGQAEFDGAGIIRAWIDGRRVPVNAFCTATERSLREQATRYPDGPLARDLARLDAMRASLRAARAAARQLVIPTVRRPGVRPSAHSRRTPRRARRSGFTRRAKSSGADPPGRDGDPPRRAPLLERRGSAFVAPNHRRRLAWRA